ncbi:ankyrin repeat-containing protein BDA1 [Eucalyptus grandis]|uniref:ankyrin repeat-containing protein BDA1 n=1 Tax=Eucalyptus grandis TaxID=71139 RepID=UPI00192EA9B7|nr:ankyrin repeat-containing protein BDA1 [Eucalyptus grandis]
MDRFLEEAAAAAAEGVNIEGLRDLIRRDGRYLQELADRWDGYTPLHVACAANLLNLVKELLTQLPDFAGRKDKYGLSPLHIAAAHGHVEIAEELVRGREDLCSVKGLENKIPLHYAIENGKFEVMKVLLSASLESVKETTSRKETALHLAVKNDQFDAVTELVTHLKRHHMKKEINRKDNEGNTALHLAVAAKNFQVVDFMLRQHSLRHVFVNVNAHNNRGRTPLDFSGRETGDRAIRGILNAVGAMHGRGRHSSLVLVEESGTDVRNALLVVAGLILNATFQSVLQPPHFKTKVDETHTEGFLASYASYMTGFLGRDLAYIIFVIGNTFGFLVSVQMIICLTRDLIVRLPVLLSMTLMVQTYYCHTYYLPFMMLEKEFSLKNAQLLSVLPLMIPILLLLFQRPLALALEFYLEKLSLFDHLRDMYHI